MPEKPKFGEEKFLRKKYWERKEFQEAVDKAAQRKKRKTTEKIPPKPEEKIRIYLERIKEAIEEKLPALKRLLYKSFIIKPENITDEYIRNTILGNFAELKGYNREDLKDPKIKEEIISLFKQEKQIDIKSYKIPEEEKRKVIEAVIKNQKESLDMWLEYLISPHAENYPLSFRYWAFVEMLKLGVYQPEKKDFTKRTSTTIAPFPELHPQALSLVLDGILKKYSKELSYPSRELPYLLITEEQRKEIKEILERENFGKLYGFALDYVRHLEYFSDEILKVTEGKWVKFPRTKNSKKRAELARNLVDSIKEFNTGWCIAGEGTANYYLERSNILIYFSKGKPGEKKKVKGELTEYYIPRAVIVTYGKNISEVRGILQTKEAKQHLDSYIIPIVDEKLKELPGGKEWQEIMSDMKKLRDIYLKHLRNEELSKEDIIFLYEIKKHIRTTGFGKDPRIEKIIMNRNIKKDLAYVLNIPEEQISTNREEALSGNIIFHYGDLDLTKLTFDEWAKLPKEVSERFDLYNLTSAEGLILPEEINRSLNLFSLTSAEGLILPKEVSGSLDLSTLTSAEGLKLPEKVGGNLYLSSLTSAEILKLPEKVGGNLDLSSLTSAEELILPKEVGGNLNLSRLTSAEILKLPEKVGGNLDLSSLTSAEGLKLPRIVKGLVRLALLPASEKERLRKIYPSLKIE